MFKKLLFYILATNLWKDFWKFNFNEMFNFFFENELISPNQSGFKPGDSRINQILAIIHEICKSLDDGFEVRGVFLDISKAFDKLWHEVLIFKFAIPLLLNWILTWQR